MSKFILLHQKVREGVKPIWINVDHISSIESEKDGTRLYTKTYTFHAEEDVSTILDAICGEGQSIGGQQ